MCRDDQVQLQSRLAAIEKKIIVGGENLLEKAEEQEKLLEQSAKELEDLRKQLAEGGGGSGSEEGSSEEEFSDGTGTGTKIRRKKRRGGKGVSKEKMQEIVAAIAADR